jgi:hypothetical protein
VVFCGEVLNANRMSSTLVENYEAQLTRAEDDYCHWAPRPGHQDHPAVRWPDLLLALVLGVWKYRQIMTSDDHRAHP